MTYQYDPYKYTETKRYGSGDSEVIFELDPTVEVPVPEDHEDYGRTLQEIHGMSDEEANDLVTEEKWAQVRKYRDARLKETDWVSGEDVPQAIKDQYFPYRQALRDVTTASSPDSISWPDKP